MALAHCLPLYTNENERGTPCEADLTSLKGVFDACDENRDGFLTLEELCGWMKKLGLHLTRHGLQELVHSCDRNLDGRLDFDEFVTLSSSLGIPASPTDPYRIATNPTSNGHDQAVAVAEESETADLQEAFLVFDKDCNGLISPSELKSTLSQLGLLAASTTFSRIQSMIRRVDTDGDGEVNFSEFQSMMKAGCIK